MQLASSTPASPDVREPRGAPFRWLLNLFSNVWFGVSLMAALFFYCSIGSAVPAVRQLPLLEMTEFEWFHWWPFDTLVVLLCVTLSIVTVRRIRLRWVNAGVWMIHSGIIILCLGSYYYFSTKIEGDAPVVRRRVKIELPGLSEPANLIVLPGSRTAVIAGPDQWRFSIQSTQTNWPILSDEHKGETARAVNVAVTQPNGDTFIRQLLEGYPQYTEDILPGKGRAIKHVGTKLITDKLKLSLEYEPQEYFHVADTWALFVRRVGESRWHQRPIVGLPRYHDHIDSLSAVFAEHPMRTRTMDVVIPPTDSADPLLSVPVRATAYLRYASMNRRWREGGPALNPVLRLISPDNKGQPRSRELVAFDGTLSQLADGLGRFVWLAHADELDELPTSTLATLSASIPGTEASVNIALTPEVIVGDDGEFTSIGDTEFAYRVRQVFGDLSVSTGTVSVAMVDIRPPDGATFTRMVADDPQMTKDLHDLSVDPHAGGSTEAKPLDKRIEMKFTPESPPLIFAAVADGGLHLIFNTADGRQLLRELPIGESVEVVPGFEVTAIALMTHAIVEEKPYVVPPSRRERNANVSLSMVRLEIGAGSAKETKWLPFSPYVFESDQYVGTGRFSYRPTRIALPNGDAIEVAFSRERRRLPNAIALDDFELRTHIGGYTGSSLTILNYVSKLRFLDADRWSDATAIQVNAPTEYGGYWYFQSTWDPPSREAPGSGLNYTGLGVGNRNGVYVQLAGCCLSVTGMIFAFYIKPILIRRRQRRNRNTDTSLTEEIVGSSQENVEDVEIASAPV